MVRRILVALILSLLAVPARSITDSEIRDCLDFDECAIVNRPTQPIGLFLAILLAVFGGCGHADPCPVEPQTWTDLGIGIYVETDAAEWAHAPDLADRVDRIAVAVAVYAGYDPVGFAGATLVFRAAPLVSCGDIGCREGCTHGDWIDLATGMEYSEEISIPLIGHEALHFLIGDPNHLSPLWANLWLNALHDL